MKSHSTLGEPFGEELPRLQCREQGRSQVLSEMRHPLLAIANSGCLRKILFVPSNGFSSSVLFRLWDAYMFELRKVRVAISILPHLSRAASCLHLPSSSFRTSSLGSLLWSSARSEVSSVTAVCSGSPRITVQDPGSVLPAMEQFGEPTKTLLHFRFARQ